MIQNSVLVFPRGFVWGAATAAYQIEGGANDGGRGESIWDRFSHTPGKVLNGDTGDIACDHYNRFADDVSLMKELGMKGYRFSISWPRVLPNGRGPANLTGLDFYDRLVDTLLEAGIEPYVTLFHWDLPQALQDAGGWTNRDVTGYFADYAALMAKRLSDRVKNWMTINEPWVVAVLGHLQGDHAPGIKDKSVAIRVGHNLMVAHGKAMQAIKAAHEDANVGIALSLWPHEPASDSEEDMKIAERSWQINCGWFLSPLLKACYPAESYDEYPDLSSCIDPGDMALVSQKMDFLGVNYYSRTLIGAGGEVRPVNGAKYTEMGWEVCPSALGRLLNRMNESYELPPIYITENGAAFKDSLNSEGHVHDRDRITFIHDHLSELWKAMKNRVPVKGYFVWSLLDNFEWQFGFDRRFGIVYVDYETQKRYVKDSGHWYSRVARRGELKL